MEKLTVASLSPQRCIHKLFGHRFIYRLLIPTLPGGLSAVEVGQLQYWHHDMSDGGGETPQKIRPKRKDTEGVLVLQFTISQMLDIWNKVIIRLAADRFQWPPCTLGCLGFSLISIICKHFWKLLKLRKFDDKTIVWFGQNDNIQYNRGWPSVHELVYCCERVKKWRWVVNCLKFNGAHWTQSSMAPETRVQSLIVAT